LSVGISDWEFTTGRGAGWVNLGAGGVWNEWVSGDARVVTGIRCFPGAVRFVEVWGGCHG
jgi:hypothetical protein